jgi:hypothetical protein
VGEYGSAETASGRLRDLSAAEAHAVDLNGSYRQVYLDEEFEQAVDDLLTRHRNDP